MVRQRSAPMVVPAMCVAIVGAMLHLMLLAPLQQASCNEIGLGGGRRAWPKEMDDDPPVEPRYKYTKPPDVPWVHEGDIFTLRKQHDVLAVLVIQPYVCPKCVFGHEALVAARNKIYGDETGHLHALLAPDARKSIGFGVLDAEDEAPEFISLFHDVDEENYRMKIPCLIIFKAHHQDVLKKPPIMFSYTESNLKTNLVPFLVRLAGPDIRPVAAEESLMVRIASPFTNRVSAVIWADQPTKVQEQLALEGRFDLHWSIVASPMVRQQLSPIFNPMQHDVVLYFYRERFGANHLPDLLGRPLSDVLEMRGFRLHDVVQNETRKQRQEDRERRALKNLLDEMLALRPGQEFERVRRPTIIEDRIPEGCEDDPSVRTALRRSKRGDRLRVRIVGKLVSTGDDFADTLEEVLTVGMSRGDFPDVLLGEGLEGLCAGSKRRLGMPALQAYQQDMLPPGVSQDAKIVFDIRMLGFAEEGATSSSGSTGSMMEMRGAAGTEGAASNPPEEYTNNMDL